MLKLDAEISALMDTLMEAVDYLGNSKSIEEMQLRIASDVSDTVSAINQSIEAEEMLKNYSINIENYKNLESSEDVQNFLENFMKWKDALLVADEARDNSTTDSFTFDFSPLAKSERKIRNYVDRSFYQLMDEIEGLTQEKIVYHIKKGFKKLDTSIQERLENYVHDFQFWGSLKPKSMDYTLFENRARELKQRRYNFVWLYERLEDHRSKKTLFAILNNWYQFDFQTLVEVKEMCYKDYFDLDILKCDHNEVMVDLGAFIGDSVVDYVNTYQAYKKIYCYEITPHTFQILEKNMQSLPEHSLYSKRGFR